jgi:two-component system, chemotaxis family, chemotaxis protein CheY
MNYIMIIDDSITIRAIVELVLKSQGFAVIHAENGANALTKIGEIMEKGDDISLCISDIDMPVMDGMTFIQEFKKLYYYIPVIMLHTQAEEILINECKELGASHVLQKPFKPELLIKAVKKLMR